MKWLKQVVATYAAATVLDTIAIVSSTFSNTFSSNNRNNISTNHGKCQKVVLKRLRDTPPQNQLQETISLKHTVFLHSQLSPQEKSHDKNIPLIVYNICNINF